ncbi:dihydrodipicolinate synthase family protein [Streptomyces boncukensis]|uniref:Dihydrodipicolinate synthase family protein n=1 Tax=Streptomyces boncukensis TaxID=2711219 RepID=A0A6G4X2P1_9ACTN|nr:dihydrodipicolinate synthase family protein [Streptomyces boncukensis]NGO71523.1 dihydrodipicolinate synthase family protein [Streptomyces boncukensis]
MTPAFARRPPAVPLTGVVPPLCTPLTDGGEVAAEGLEALVERMLTAGVSGVFVLGSTGEAAFLDDARRATALRAAVAAVDGRVPVLAGALDMTTARVIAHAEAAAQAGASALVATAPFYTRTHPAEIANHFRRIRAAVPLPLFAYDIPVAVHTKLPPAVVLELAGDGTLAGLKDSSGDDGALRRLLVELRTRGLLDRFSVLTGSELAVDGALLAGAHGVVPGLGNVDPDGYVRLCTLARAGRWSEAAAEQDRLAALFALVDAGPPEVMGRNSSAVGAFKAALHLLGVIGSPATAPPQIPLDTAAVKTVRRLLEEAGLL